MLLGRLKVCNFSLVKDTPHLLSGFQYNMTNSINEVIDFWFDKQNAKKWFNSTPEFDTEIRAQFKSLWQSAADNKLKVWEESANGCLALCIVLDQFPLNMFRGENKSFQTEHQSIQVAKGAINKGLDAMIDVKRVSFLYMPLMHSEELQDQDLCVTCFENRGLEDNLRFAKHHRGLIEEFGRFPHRNVVLGRKSTPEEIEYLNSKRAFKG